MAIARWRLRRLLAIESDLFEMETGRRQNEIDAEFPRMGDASVAWVFQKLADEGRSLALVIRYEGSLNRSYDKAFRQLLALQSTRPSPPPPPENTKIQNEPKPAPAVEQAISSPAICPPVGQAISSPAVHDQCGAATPGGAPAFKPASLESQPTVGQAIVSPPVSSRDQRELQMFLRPTMTQ